jgi:hypothetical protein
MGYECFGHVARLLVNGCFSNLLFHRRYLWNHDVSRHVGSWLGLQISSHTMIGTLSTISVRLDPTVHVMIPLPSTHA